MSKPQPQEPHGAAGRVFGCLMERMNTPSYRAALKLLAPARGGAYLEIGFGTGGLLVRMARTMREGMLAGVDPSLLMVETAQKRLARLKRVAADLRRGTASDLPWPDDSFDGAAALHCFQFWADPQGDMRHLARVLRPGAIAVFILRDHETHAPEWLPNPLSKSGDETRALIDLLAATGFTDVARQEPVGSSRIVTARKI